MPLDTQLHRLSVGFFGIDLPHPCHKPTRATPDNRGFVRVSADSQFVAENAKNQ